MHFFVVKLLSTPVMTYSYVYHLRNLRPTIRLLVTHIANKLQHARQQHVRMQRDPTVVTVV